MSKYTTTIGEILESFLSPEERYSDITVEEIINKTCDNFFNFPFKWYSENKVGFSDFKHNFLLRYYNSYIGFETLGMFKTYMSAKMNISMEYYTKLFNALQDGDSPFINHDLWVTGENENTSKDEATSTNDSENDVNYQNIDSDNPQVTIETNDYASSMSRGENVNKTHTHGVGNNNHEEKGKEVRHESGLQGKSRAEAISKYRSQIVNINRELIELCHTLFLGVW